MPEDLEALKHGPAESGVDFRRGSGTVRRRRSMDPVAERIVGFLREIGLSVRLATLEEETFLPGVTLEPNGLVVDPDALKYPGDLLHEAGHLAVMLPEDRAKVNGNAGSDQGYEIGAQCWSYAAAVHLGLEPGVVFHQDGYKGSAASLIQHYSGGLVGVPLLQWMGLTLDSARAAVQGVAPYPAMVKWLREDPSPAP